MNPKEFDFNPHQFGIGGVYLYLVGACLFILSRIKVIKLTPKISFYFFHPEEIAKFYIVGRLITALYGMGIIILSYLIAKRLSLSKKESCLVCLLILISPLLILNAHYMYVDIPGLFWIMSSIFIVTQFTERFSLKKSFVAGIFTGLACGTKIPFAISLVIPLLGCLLFSRNFKNFFKSILLFLNLNFRHNLFFFVFLNTYKHSFAYFRELDFLLQCLFLLFFLLALKCLLYFQLK